MKSLSLTTVLCLLLVGCSSQKQPDMDSDSYRQNLLNVIDIEQQDTTLAAEKKLTEAAVSVSHSLAQLAEIQHAVHPAAKIPAGPEPKRIGMADVASVDWTGPVEPLLRKVAAASHYKFRVMGKAPAIPVLVSVSAKSLPLADILRDITYQSQQHAKVVLYADQRIIELRYPQG